ncbi:MAG TPA: hypothetical protein VHG28_21720, partial [Longimicrobiaceae bacterium]|nr:hypothetical protein [Longimicrobiaceae bacterium]
ALDGERELFVAAQREDEAGRHWLTRFAEECERVEHGAHAAADADDAEDGRRRGTAGPPGQRGQDQGKDGPTGEHGYTPPAGNEQGGEVQCGRGERR